MERKITYNPNSLGLEETDIKEAQKLAEYKSFVESLTEEEARDYLEHALEGEKLAIHGASEIMLTAAEAIEIQNEANPEKRNYKRAAIKERISPPAIAYDDLDESIFQDRTILVDLVKKAKRKPLKNFRAKLIAYFVSGEFLELSDATEAAAHIANSETLQNFFEEMHALLNLGGNLERERLFTSLEGIPSQLKKEIMAVAKLVRIEEVSDLIKKAVIKVSKT